jgi:hypothetical protein
LVCIYWPPNNQKMIYFFFRRRLLYDISTEDSVFWIECTTYQKHHQKITILDHFETFLISWLLFKFSINPAILQLYNNRPYYTKVTKGRKMAETGRGTFTRVRFFRSTHPFRLFYFYQISNGRRNLGRILPSESLDQEGTVGKIIRFFKKNHKFC